MTEKKYNFVFISTNLKNGKQYVGEHSTNNLNCAKTKNYIGSGRPLFENAKKKYGKENFQRKDLDFFPSKKEAFDAQEKYIRLYKTHVSQGGYNMSWKGGHNVKECWSEESKEKMSNSSIGDKNAMFGKHHSEKSKDKMRNPKTEEHKQNIGKALTGDKNGMFGRHHSTESKQKMKPNKNSLI
jgi:group I intron endonuclease